MFDLRSDDGSVRRKAAHLPAADDGPPQGSRPRRGNRLDGAEMTALHRRLLGLYQEELDRQYENRLQMQKDADFYDNDQWSDEDKQTLMDRGQVPLVYNVISASVDWVTGTEKRARSDYKVLPRRKEDAKPAQRKTELLKYLSDVNRTPFHRSRAFGDTVKVGVGWLEDGLTADVGEEPLYCRYESWRNVLWDSAATDLALEDARYIFRSKWVDLDMAKALLPKRKHVLERSADDSDDYAFLDQLGDEAMDSTELAMEDGSYSRARDGADGYHRRRVRLVEAWIRMPTEKAQAVKGGTFSGEFYDEHSRGHRAEVESGEADVVQKPAMRMYVAIFCSAGMLYFGPSPYRHNRFPLTPIWAFRRDRDGMPYGMIRRLRDIQEDINKRASKALHILSTNKILMDDDAVPDDVELEDWIEEAGRPDGVIVKRRGSNVSLEVDRDLPQWHLELMSRSIGMIQSASGVTDELLGRRTNASSGIAIQRRQDQGSMQTAAYFDNLRFALQVQGEKQVANIEQFMDEEKAFRITNMRGTPEYVVVNDGLPENDVVRSKADFVISEADWRASVRQAAADELLDLLGKLAPVSPQVVIVMLDLLVESMDLPNREELVRRIRTVTGMRDPDAEEPTPEEIQRAQQQAQVQAMQQADAEATIAGKVAEAAKKTAEAALSEARAMQTQAAMVNQNVDAQNKALAAAREAIALPQSTHVADHILAESGFMAASDKVAMLAEMAGIAPATRQPSQAAGITPPRQAPQPQPQPMQ